MLKVKKNRITENQCLFSLHRNNFIIHAYYLFDLI